MKKSKRQRQIELLLRLLDRVNTSSLSKGLVRENTDWIHKKISQVEGNVPAGGLTKHDMLHANSMWDQHSRQVHPMFN